MKNKNDDLIELPTYEYPKITYSLNKFSLNDKVTVEQVKTRSKQEKVKIRCIGIIPGKKPTNAIETQLKVIDNYIVSCIVRDILPVIMVEKDEEITIGKAFVKGFKIKEGAIAESVFNGKQNIIAIGRDFNDIALAINHVIKLQGGIAVAKSGKIIGSISLVDNNINKHDVCEYEFIDKLIKLTKIVEEELECGIQSPFMHLSFLTLEKIPKWKITSEGLIDVEKCEVIATIIG